MKQIRAPKIIEDTSGERFILVPEGSTLKGAYCYAFEKSPNLRIILRPKQIEKQFIRNKEVSPKVVTQGKYECAIASLSMLTKVSIDRVREVSLSKGWQVEEGVSLALTKKILRALGFRSMFHDRFPQQECLVHADSINVTHMGHCLYFDGKNILDPQTHNQNFLWYGPDWGPEEIGKTFLTIEPLEIEHL